MNNQEIINLSRIYTTTWLKGSTDGRAEVLQSLFHYEKKDSGLFARLVAMIGMCIFSRAESTACVEDFLDNIYQPFD